MSVFDVLQERGFIAQVSHEEEIRELLEKEKITFYIGFDPTRSFHRTDGHGPYAAGRAPSYCIAGRRHRHDRRPQRQGRHAQDADAGVH